VRPPLEYGDNFPVAAESWDPTVPWRFPRSEGYFRRPSRFSRALPWITLGLGVTLGVLWMSWRMDLPARDSQGGAEQRSGGRQEEVLRAPSVAPAKAAPAARPMRLRSRVA
jgi:hypothetical protein